MLGLAIRQTLKILRLLEGSEENKGWKNLFLLMIFFLFGYAAVTYIVVIGATSILQVLTGVIFFFGAVFVLIVVFLGLRSMRSLKEAKDDQKEKVVQLEKQFEQLKQLYNATSHDLKEPINTITNSLAIIKRDHSEKLSDTGSIFFEYAEKAANRMAVLVKSLSEYIKVGTKEHKKVIETKELVQTVLEELHGSISSSNALINVHLLPSVQANESELKRVFQNIISNAMKYRKPDIRPEIDIYAQQKPEGFWTFSIRDNGIGINDMDFPKVFQLFKRVDESETEGLGIGMAISKKVVEAHGGTMWLQSEEGVGTEFHFTLKA